MSKSGSRKKTEAISSDASSSQEPVKKESKHSHSKSTNQEYLISKPSKSQQQYLQDLRKKTSSVEPPKI